MNQEQSINPEKEVIRTKLTHQKSNKIVRNTKPHMNQSHIRGQKSTPNIHKEIDIVPTCQTIWLMCHLNYRKQESDLQQFSEQMLLSSMTLLLPLREKSRYGISKEKMNKSGKKGIKRLHNCIFPKQRKETIQRGALI